MACRSESHESWSVETEKCSLINQFFDRNNNLLEGATLEDEIATSECCNTGFTTEDVYEKPILLKACE